VFALLRFVHLKKFIPSIDIGSDIDLVLREESEKVSELKSVSGSNKLPYGTLALGSEGIKDAITGFEDAYVSTFILPNTDLTASFLTDENRISRTSVSHPSYSTQKKVKHTRRNLRHPRNPWEHPFHPQASHQASSPSLKAAQSPTRQQPPYPPLHLVPLAVRRLSVVMADKLVWAQR
jgi:hypothetical protein